MRRNYIKAKSLSTFLRLYKKWTTLLSKTKNSLIIDLAQLKTLNSLSFNLGIKKILAFASFNTLVTLGLTAQISFTEITNRNEQVFKTSTSVFFKAAPTFADIDNDGDLDLLVGNIRGDLVLFLNDDDTFRKARGEENPFTSFFNRIGTAPKFVDWDQDGDPDLLVVKDRTSLAYFENNNGDFTELTGAENPFNNVNDTFQGIGDAFAFADIDSDGDLDFLIESQNFSNNFDYYKNEEGVLVEQDSANNPFQNMPSDEGNLLSIEFIDLDKDNDPDIVQGNLDGTLVYFENNGNVFTQLDSNLNPFNDFSVQKGSSPTFADLDEDGDLDLVLGDYDGDFHYFLNNNQTFTEATEEENPFSGFFEKSLLIPQIIDLDHDNDQDIVLAITNNSTDSTSIAFFKNENGIYTEQFNENNPFKSIAPDGINIFPYLADFNQDGEIDLILSYTQIDTTLNSSSGIIDYYINTNGEYIKQLGENNPFNSIINNHPLIPQLVDWDLDGDLDLIGSDSEYQNAPKFYLNTNNQFTEKSTFENHFLEETVQTFSYTSIPNLVDLDQDGDLDLVLGELYTGGIKYFQNNDNNLFELENENNPFNSPIINEIFPFMSFGDLDNDGDLDVLSSAFYGGLIEFKNNSVISGVFKYKSHEPISVYPNPSNSIVNTEIGLLKITDLKGNLLFETFSNGQIDISFLENGVYILSQNGKKQQVFKN